MTLNELQTYFNSLATSHVDINDFVWGDAFEQLQDLINDTSDILLMVESPDYQMDNLGYTGRMISYESELVILKLTQKDNKTQKKNDLISTMSIMNEVIRKVEEDFQENDHAMFSIRSAFTQAYLDARIGWRVSYSISFDTDVYPNSAKWQ